MQTSPRFIVIAAAPRYGSRDEFIGFGPARTVFTAETRGWLDHRLNQLPDYWFNDLDVDIVDTQPEKELDNWGPKLPLGWARDEELPF